MATGILNKEQLVKQLIEADLQVLGDYKDAIYSEEGSNFYDFLLVQFGVMGYDSDTSRVIVETSFWYYSCLVNEDVYKLMGIHAEYCNSLHSILKERCDNLHFSKDDVVAVASILYWQHTKSLNTTCQTEFPVFPELVDVSKILTGEEESSSLILERDFLENWLPDIQMDCAESIKETLFWNLLRIYGFGSVLPQESADLVFEAVAEFMHSHFHLIYNNIAYPLSLAIKHLKMEDIDYIKLLNIAEHAEAVGVAELCASITDEETRKVWYEWRNINKPPKEVHCFVYALAYLDKPGSEYFSKFISKECQEFINDVSKLVAICQKSAPTLLLEYVGQRYQQPCKLIKGVDGLVAIFNDTSPRSIKTMVQELDVPIKNPNSLVNGCDDLLENTVSSPISLKNDIQMHLPFPDRFKNSLPNSRKKVLMELYKFVGNKFTTESGKPISEDDFVILFGYHDDKLLEHFKPPYCWIGTRTEFQYLTLLLYPAGIGDEGLLNELIKDSKDIDKRWSENRSAAKKQFDSGSNKTAEYYKNEISKIASNIKA